MMSPNEVKAIVTVAEMCKVFYDTCIAQGFTNAQAIALTAQIPRATFSVRPEGATS